MRKISFEILGDIVEDVHIPGYKDTLLPINLVRVVGVVPSQSHIGNRTGRGAGRMLFLTKLKPMQGGQPGESQRRY